MRARFPACAPRYRERGAAFVHKLLAFLAAGCSRSPQQLARIVDVDLDDPAFWTSGLELVGAQVQVVEDLDAELSAERAAATG